MGGGFCATCLTLLRALWPGELEVPAQRDPGPGLLGPSGVGGVRLRLGSRVPSVLPPRRGRQGCLLRAQCLLCGRSGGRPGARGLSWGACAVGSCA